MNILNENVKHIMFGSGVITEVKDNKILVQFEENIGTKMFLYPDVFEKFLRAENQDVENDVMEELHKKLEQIDLERKEKERKKAELEQKLVQAAKKPASRTKKKTAI